jgi:hypothetical protein
MAEQEEREAPREEESDVEGHMKRRGEGEPPEEPGMRRESGEGSDDVEAHMKR